VSHCGGVRYHSGGVVSHCGGVRYHSGWVVSHCGGVRYHSRGSGPAQEGSGPAQEGRVPLRRYRVLLRRSLVPLGTAWVPLVSKFARLRDWVGFVWNRTALVGLRMPQFAKWAWQKIFQEGWQKICEDGWQKISKVPWQKLVVNTPPLRKKNYFSLGKPWGGLNPTSYSEKKSKKVGAPTGVEPASNE
jgi:hypothetical protein